MADTAPSQAPPVSEAPGGDGLSAGGSEEEGGYIKTAAHNYVSRKATIHGAQNVELRGKSIIERGVNIHGENSKIRIGRYCKFGENATLKPATVPIGKDDAEEGGEVKYLPLIIGTNTAIGSNTTSQAAAIGSSVIIGQNCTLGNRSIVKDCVYIEDESVVPSDMVIPPFSVVRGNPAQILMEEIMPESSAVVIPEGRVEEFGEFVRSSGH